MAKRTVKFAAVGAILLALVTGVSSPPLAMTAQPVYPTQFTEIAPQGFGDRQNSGAWSMQWWNGKLYVGTVRAWFCWSEAAFYYLAPQVVPYPPIGSHFDCTPDPRDLPLRAEIWQYTPETETWERVYQAPNDVEIPGSPGMYTARDAGYRDMVVFEEADGTEALYVAGATANSVWHPLPPPRILRSTDGETFEPIPQDPGTVLGDLGEDQATFRDFEVFDERLYVLNGVIHGYGLVMESEDPASGNDSFRWVTMQDVQVFEMCPYNGYLYLGLSAPFKGYGVSKMDTSGTPPYPVTPVVIDGAFRKPLPSLSVVSMHVYKDRLYVGTDKPAELIRINPDDSWDLIVGSPRETPDGWKYPLSGFDSGFDWPLVGHMWRMQAHQGLLYVGTHDRTTGWADLFPWLDEALEHQQGFDLYETSDGQSFSPITVIGLGDKFQAGIRTFASTPHGLYAGSISWWYGLRVYRGTRPELHWTFLPLVAGGSGSVPAAQPSRASVPGVSNLSLYTHPLAPPGRLDSETRDGRTVLSWEPPPEAVQFRVMRSDPIANSELFIPDLDPNAWVPGRFVEVGTTSRSVFVDSTGIAGRPYHYYVLAENAAGTLSQPSNLMRVPSLAQEVTFENLLDTLNSWLHPDDQAPTQPDQVVADLTDARDCFLSGDLEGAAQRLERMAQGARGGQVVELPQWRADDLEILVHKLARRVRLAQAGLIAPWELN